MSSTTSASASASATGEAAPSSTSLSSLVSTLVPTLIIAAVYVGIFLVLRRTQKRFYAPRTYLGSLRESERTPALPTGLFNWFGAFWNIKDTYALQHQGLDAFLFLRFLRTIVFIMFMGCVMLWPIMFPVNATGGAGALQLDMLSYSNIDNKTQYNRYYAHVFTAWLYYGFVMYTILRETIYYINLRQAFLMSPFFANRISTRTVLFTGVPEQYLDEAKLRKVFGDVAKTIWITGDTEELDKLVKERDKVAMRLEKAEVKLIKLANAERLKAIKNGGSDERTEAPADAETGNLAARWVPDKKRPTHRTGFLGLIGPKVDSITWCRSELERLIPEVGKAQATYRSGTGKKVPGVFIEFFTQVQAEAAHQTLTHHQALQMTPKYIGITPGEVVWSSLKVSWWQRVVRRYAVIGFITAMIVFWAAPVAFVGSISNIDSLKTISFLTWLDKIPPVIMGVVSGLLPAVALAILMALVPIVMRICAKLSGEPSLSRVELFTQNAYFAFQVIQVFLVATLGSVATSVGKQIADNPASATTLLAQNIPKASNLYIPFFIVQGLTIASGVLSQVVGFVIFNLLYKYLTGTPRAMYIKWANMATISWGSVLPVYTNIAVISIVYAGIAPLVLGFATIGLFLFYLAYKYNILFVTDTTIDTRGLIYPRALKHLFAGIYVAEVCMVGLFAASVAVGPLVLMVAFLVFTILFHMTINSALDPLLYNLPQTLVAEEQMLRDGAARIASAETDPKNGAAEKNGAGAPETEAPVKGGMVASFLKPWQFADYATLRKLVPHNSIDVNSLYSDEVEKHAYYPPTVTSPTPLLWIPEDAAGISKQEIRDTGKVIPITDEGCTLSDKNKLEWDTETVRPPVWEEKIYY